MNYAENFETLVRRRQSVRKFDQLSLNKEDSTSIEKIFSSIETINSNEKLDWEIGGHLIIGSGIAFSRADNWDNRKLVEYGFEGEQLVLKLTEMNYGTCWSRLPNGQALIIFGYSAKNNGLGRAESLLYRGMNRKPLSELLVGENIELNGSLSKILESGRLAPSAFNRQFWTFHVPNEKEITVRLKGKPPVIYGDMVYVDLGVVLSHLYFAANEITGKAKIEELTDYKYRIKLE